MNAHVDLLSEMTEKKSSNFIKYWLHIFHPAIITLKKNSVFCVNCETWRHVWCRRSCTVCLYLHMLLCYYGVRCVSIYIANIHTSKWKRKKQTRDKDKLFSTWVKWGFTFVILHFYSAEESRCCHHKLGPVGLIRIITCQKEVWFPCCRKCSEWWNGLAELEVTS